MPLSRHSVGTDQETSPHTTRQGTRGHSHLSLLSHWSDPGLKCGISVHELISTSEKKKAGQEWIVEHSPRLLASKDKANI